MQDDKKFTKIKVTSDYPTSVSSKAYGANIDCFAFNADLIARAAPNLMVDLMELYEKCRVLRPGDPVPDEDYALATERLMKHIAST